MKLSQALLVLPLAMALPAHQRLTDIDITIKFNSNKVFITDDDDYYSCLVKTFPPDYTGCPAGYEAVPILEGEKCACCTKNEPDDGFLLALQGKVLSLTHDAKISKNFH